MMAVGFDEAIKRKAEAAAAYVRGELPEGEVEALRRSFRAVEWERIENQRALHAQAMEAERIERARKDRIASLVAVAQRTESAVVTNQLLAEILKKLHGMA